MIPSASIFCALNVDPAIFSVRPALSSFEIMLANMRLTICVRPSIVAIFLSCSFASIVTKFASANRFFVTVSSCIFAIDISAMILELILYAYG